MSIIIPANSAVGGGGYEVSNSLRFAGAARATYLTATFGSAPTLATKNTISLWFKRSKFDANQQLYTTNNNAANIIFNRSGASTGPTAAFYTNSGQLLGPRQYRDTSAWMHFVYTFDSTQGTAANRTKVYINGVQETSFNNTAYPAQNEASQLGVNGVEILIGTRSDHDRIFDGYMAETAFVDGQALDATSFGEFDSDSGIWKPIDISGLTFGNNGFYLEYKQSGTGTNASGMGADTSGNNLNFAVNNFTALDQSTDTCTNNFATLNPLYKQDGVFSEGNLAYTISASDFDSALSTIAPSLGKWYFETKITAQAGSNTTRSAFGICDVRDGNLISEDELGQNPSGRLGDTLGYAGNGSGNVLKNGSDQGSGFNTTYGTNDILSCAVDLDNGAVYYRKNGGSWFNSGNPESGASKTGAVTITTGQEYVFGNTAYAGSAFIMNFGNPAYAISSGNTDGNSRGNFEYAVPSGYLSLCSANLSEVLS